MRSSVYLPSLAMFILTINASHSPLKARNLSLPDFVQRDGIYSVFINDAGKQVYEIIAEPNTNYTDGHTPALLESFPEKAELMSRSTGHCFCGCGINLHHGDTDAAVADLTDQVARAGTLKTTGCWYSIRGSVVAFICNQWGNVENTNDFWAEHVGSSLAVVTADCGWYVAGTYSWGYILTLNVGYMVYYPGQDFGANAMGSDRWDC